MLSRENFGVQERIFCISETGSDLNVNTKCIFTRFTHLKLNYRREHCIRNCIDLDS